VSTYLHGEAHPPCAGPPPPPPPPPDLTFLGPRHYPARPISLFRVSEFEMKNSDYPLVN